MPRDIANVAALADERTRSITAENPDGEKGAGGQAASNLGTGRKGRPCLTVESGDTVTLADIDGPGEIRHVWITLPDATSEGSTVFRDLLLRAYWDDEEEPSIEVPLGDFFCSGHATRCLFESEAMVVGPDGGLNCYLPMPFEESARLTVESEHQADVGGFYYQIDYALGPDLGDDAYLHAQWRRENPTTRGEDYTILDGVEGRGHYVGTFLAWTTLSEGWWGEGEVKFYLDGDEEWPTICGTGTEDYFGGAWNFETEGDTPETFTAPYLGYHFHDPGGGGRGRPPRNGLYRWHIPDPVRFEEDLRVTVQQIGHGRDGYRERSDDVASVAYWYQDEPHAAFPEVPGPKARQPR